MNARVATLADEVSNRGFAIVTDVVPAPEIARQVKSCENWISATQAKAHALRNLSRQVPATRELAANPRIRDIVESILGPGGFAVRTIYFDKLPGANWKVAWHQDLSIAVQEWRDVAGFGPWSLKDGVPHVEPPTELLERMITLRIHLDDCDEDNGPLRVIDGSHRLGRLSDEQIREAAATRPSTTCTVAAGGIIAMRPLILHASSPANLPRHRRVIHIEYAAEQLPGGLRWAEA